MLVINSNEIVNINNININKNKKIPRIFHFCLSMSGQVTNTSTNGVNIRDGDMNMAAADLRGKRRRKQTFSMKIKRLIEICQSMALIQCKSPMGISERTKLCMLHLVSEPTDTVASLIVCNLMFVIVSNEHHTPNWWSLCTLHPGSPPTANFSFR